MLSDLRNDLLGEGACVQTPFGERRVTYADYIASGRSLASVEDALRASVLPLYANTHTEDSATGATTTHLVHDAAEYIKSCLGADENYKLVFPGTGATGALKRLQEILGVSVSGQWRDTLLASLDPSERLVVFVGPYEHHSNELSWRESLAETVTVPLDEHGLIDLRVLEERLSDPRYDGRVKVGSFSAASNVTGLLTDVRAVARLLHEHGALAVFDYAASAPYVRIDVRPSHEGATDWLDAIVLSPHKFLGGPGSPGLLLFHKSLYHLSSPTTAGGGTVSYVSYTKHRYYDDIEVREDAGTPAIVQKVRAALAFRVKEQVGVDAIEERERDLIGRALPRLAAIEGVRLLGNVDAPRLAVASFLVESGGKQLHAKFVVRLLSDLFGIQGRAGCSCAGPYGHALLNIDEETSSCFLEAIEAGYEGVKPGWTRLSFHYLIDDDEMEFLIDAVAFVARNGFRFLPLYTFDWRTGAWRHKQASATHAPGSDPGSQHAFDPSVWQAVRRSTSPRRDDYAEYVAAAERLVRELVAASPTESAALDGHAESLDDQAPTGLDERVLWFAR
ncbi:MAG TPA: aminotransferase class V-fold PLP-dependent enzyme [Trueperaceae bacterium]|nr:aminotransferase class V-fold PLP-dependent enzyme [Trueperaceae bacterium]